MARQRGVQRDLRQERLKVDSRSSRLSDATPTYCELALRRDRIWWPAWIVVLSVQVVAVAGAYESLYPSPQSRLTLGPTLGDNPSLRALYGPAFDLASPGGFVAWRMGGFVAAFIGLMSLLAVVRHTRAEEEAGRLELLRSGVVGRHAPLAAALLVTIGANIVLAAIVIVGPISQITPVAGATALGLGFLGCGFLFAGLGAVTAQISENAGPARGMAASVLGLAYLLRAVGDSSETATWLHWLSPVGWVQQARAFAGERWWVLGIPLVVGLALIALAVSLEGRRDFGAGLRASPLGPERAAVGLSTAAGLAWRLQRGVAARLDRRGRDLRRGHRLGGQRGAPGDPECDHDHVDGSRDPGFPPSRHRLTLCSPEAALLTRGRFRVEESAPEPA